MTARAVYRLYDRDGRLLYPGSSSNPELRLRTHCYRRGCGAPWGHYVTAMTVDWFVDADRAKAEEQRAHLNEDPIFCRPFGNSRRNTELRAASKVREAQYVAEHEPIVWNDARHVRCLGPLGVGVSNLGYRVLEAEVSA